MTDVFLNLINRSIAAGWLVLAVLLLRFLLKSAPKSFRCILWGLVGLRLICPFSIQSIFSLVPSAQTISRGILYAQAPAIHSGVETVDRVVNTTVMESLTPQTGASVNPIQIWLTLAAAIWLLGIASLLLYAALTYYRLRRDVRASLLLGDGVYLCDYIRSPFILGIAVPRIYLPSSLSSLDAAMVLSHEKMHIRRKDHWWKPLGCGLLVVYWFHPLIWIAYFLFCRDIELACDEAVIKRLSGPDKKAYSNALLNCSVPRFRVAACPLAFGESAVKERIKAVLNYKKPGFWVLLTAAAACVLAVVCFLTDPSAESPDAPGDNSALASPLETTVMDAQPGANAVPPSQDDSWEKGYGPCDVTWVWNAHFQLPDGWKLSKSTGTGYNSTHVLSEVGFAPVNAESGDITLQYVEFYYYEHIFLPSVASGYTAGYMPIPPLTTGICYTPESSDLWRYITIEGVDGVCIIKSETDEAWKRERSDEIMSILGTLDLPNCRISREDILRVAENLWQDLEHDQIHAELDTDIVCWVLTAYREGTVAGTMYLDQMGNILPYSNDKPASPGSANP